MNCAPAGASQTSQPLSTAAMQAQSAQTLKPVTEIPAQIPVTACQIKEEPVKETPGADEEPGVLQDSEVMVLDILKTHKPQGALARDTIQNVLRTLGYAMLNVDSILAKLKTAGEIIEPKEGFFRAV